LLVQHVFVAMKAISLLSSALAPRDANMLHAIPAATMIAKTTYITRRIPSLLHNKRIGLHCSGQVS